jgi:hypothetical protein
MSHPDPLDMVALPGEDGTPLQLNAFEADELQSLLEANGIEATITGAEMLPNLPYRVMVPAAELGRAVEAIQAARETGAAGAEEAESAGEATA